MNKIFIALLILVLVSCGAQKEKPEGNYSDSYVKIVSENVETYSDEGVSKESIEYIYETPDDYFWKKAIYKDQSGAIIKTIEREFDADRNPIKEFTRELDSAVTASEIVSFDHNSKILTGKITFDGEPIPENMKMSYKFFYDNGKLIAEEVERFSAEPEFKNKEGNNVTMKYRLRYFPSDDSRPAGNYQTSYLIENLTRYFTPKDKERTGLNLKIGDVYLTDSAKFNEAGLPVYRNSQEPECESALNQEWFKIEKDAKGKLQSITGYCNEKLDSNAENNTRIQFAYNQSGQLSKITEYKYNAGTKKFDKIHDTKTYVFYGMEFSSDYNAADVDLLHEHYCLGEKQFNVSHTKIVKFEGGEKIIEEHTGSYPGDYTGKLPEMKLKQRRTIKYEVVKRD